MIGRLALFVGLTAAVWLLLVIPARHWWGDPDRYWLCDAVTVGSAVALAVCLVPATVTLAWSLWSLGKPPEQQVTAVLGGTGLRLFVVAGVAFACYQQVEFLRQDGAYFWMWILVFYGVTLALEVVFLLRAVAGRAPQKAEARQ